MRIIYLIFLVSNLIFSQELTFSKASNLQNYIQFNNELKKVVNSKDVIEIEKYIKKHPNKINDAIESVEFEGEYLSKVNKLKPIIHTLLDNSLLDKDYIKILNLFLNNGADIYIEFQNLPILYRLLDFVAKTQKEDCKNAVEILEVIIKKDKKIVQEKYKNESPPLPYLLRKNFEFLGNKYSADYLPNEVIKTLIKNGSNTNSYDQFGNNLLAFCSQTGNIEIQNYLFENGINMQNVNENGKDAMYYAIRNQMFDIIKNLTINNYKLSPSKLMNMKLTDLNFITNMEIYSYLSIEAFKYVNDYEEAKNYLTIFEKSKTKILENNYYKNLYIDLKKYPEFVYLLEKDNPKFSSNELQIIKDLKVEYINSFSEISEVIEALKIFKLVKIDNYTSDYFTNESKTNAIYHSIEKIDQILYPSVKNNLLNNIKAKSNNYFNKIFFEINSIRGFVDLKNNFPSKTQEITLKAFEIVSYFNYVNTDNIKWSKNIYSVRDKADNFITEANQYLENFNYKNEIVINNKNLAIKTKNDSHSNYNRSRQYEKSLEENARIILSNLKNTSILPEYEVTEKERNNDYIVYKIKPKGYNTYSFSGFEIRYDFDDKEYYIPSMLGIGTDGEFKSITEAIKVQTLKTVFLNQSFGNSLYSLDYMAKETDYTLYEKIISEYRKNGIENWFNMKIR